MGNFNITIQGVGCHHNGNDNDAEQMTAKFVQKLIKEGFHHINSATFTSGSSLDLTDKTQLMELKRSPAGT